MQKNIESEGIDFMELLKEFELQKERSKEELLHCIFNLNLSANDILNLIHLLDDFEVNYINYFVFKNNSKVGD